MKKLCQIQNRPNLEDLFAQKQAGLSANSKTGFFCQKYFLSYLLTRIFRLSQEEGFSRFIHEMISTSINHVYHIKSSRI